MHAAIAKRVGRHARETRRMFVLFEVVGFSLFCCGMFVVIWRKVIEELDTDECCDTADMAACLRRPRALDQLVGNNIRNGFLQPFTSSNRRIKLGGLRHIK